MWLPLGRSGSASKMSRSSICTKRQNTGQLRSHYPPSAPSSPRRTRVITVTKSGDDLLCNQSSPFCGIRRSYSVETCTVDVVESKNLRKIIVISLRNLLGNLLCFTQQSTFSSCSETKIRIRKYLQLFREHPAVFAGRLTGSGGNPDVHGYLTLARFPP